MPARPGGVDFAYAFDFAVGVVAFRGEVLPHEEVGGSVVDGGAEGGEGLEGCDGEGGGGFWRGGGGEPVVGVGEDEAHHVGSADERGLAIQDSYAEQEASSIPTDPTDSHLLPFQPFHTRYISPIGACAYGPAQWRLDIGPHHAIPRIFLLCCSLTQTSYPAFCETNADVYLVGLEGGNHVACTGWKGNERAREPKVGLSEIKRGGEMFFRNQSALNISNVTTAGRGGKFKRCLTWYIANS